MARESILSIRCPHKDMKTRLCACVCKFDELTLICTGHFRYVTQMLSLSHDNCNGVKLFQRKCTIVKMEMSFHRKILYDDALNLC